MGVGKIIQIVAVLAAIIAGLWSGFPEAAMVIAILGAIGGWFIAEEDRQRVLVAAIALSIISDGLGAIPGVGQYISNVMASLGNLYAAGGITVILVCAEANLYTVTVFFRDQFFHLGTVCNDLIFEFGSMTTVDEIIGSPVVFIPRRDFFQVRYQSVLCLARL